MLCGTLLVNAAVNYMTVELKTGDKFSFLLKAKPVITYGGGNMEINDGSTTNYALNSVKNYHFTESDESGVDNMGADILRIVSIDENTIGVENAQAGAGVTLLTAGGTIVSTTTTDQAGTATITLPSAQGVYVLSVGKQSFKLIRK